ncbi:hypothetical protein BdWA1_001549 [Babesia duncani]|uniref:Uncharacterized protein n=1 Tax=Babesia duncani TaxID=323732 RepID=A0AAD9PKV1_9APIC|nr:hypothetical protein BdWA1_001549 [Babesia duncani]
MHHPKRTVRKYQFDPLAHSALFPLVARHVRAHICQQRAALFKKTEWRRAARKHLFDQLSCMQDEFIRPETLQELVHRVGHVNTLIATKTELKSALESLKSLVQWADNVKFDKSSPGIFTCQCDTTLEEQLEEMRLLNLKRQERKVKFLEKLHAKAKQAIDSNQNLLSKVIDNAEKLARDEKQEEEIWFIPSDRKLAACNINTRPKRPLVPTFTAPTATPQARQ